MSNVWTIYKNELQLYRFSWLGWSAILIVNIIAGLGYLFGAVNFGNFQYFFNLVEMPFAWSIFIIGARVFAKDKELGLYSLFFTSPINLREIIWAKYLALVTFFVFCLISLLFFPLLSVFFFSISGLSVLSGFFAVFLLILLFSSIILFSSSCTDNTMIAIVLSFGIWILFYLLGSVYKMFGVGAESFLKSISYLFHFNNISSGVFSLGDVLYFIAIKLFLLKLTESKILSQVAY